MVERGSLMCWSTKPMRRLNRLSPVAVFASASKVDRDVDETSLSSNQIQGGPQMSIAHFRVFTKGGRHAVCRSGLRRFVVNSVLGTVLTVIPITASAQLGERDQLWHQDSSGIEGTAEAEDEFGTILAAGDFNGDGHEDLAIGVPGEDLGSITSAGVVQVLYGGSDGFSAAGNQLWHQDSPGIGDMAETSDEFGSALAAGDFTGDGYDDLAIGVPWENLGGTRPNAGVVHVLYGGPGGLSASFSQVWDRITVVGAAEIGDRFGWALSAGDFDGDGHDDLAIGIPRDDIDLAQPSGAVVVLHGSLFGLGTPIQFWHQDSPGIEGTAEIFDFFGGALAAGDFDDDGHDDLAIGVQGEDIGSTSDTGVVQVLYGSSVVGLSATGSQLWDQDSSGITGIAEEGDGFGAALAVGDFDGDGHDDLAIGVPLEDLDATSDTGVVHLLYGSVSGLAATGNQLWHQDSSGIAGIAEGGDFFGEALAAGDFDADGHDDLAIGVPYENLSSMSRAGGVQVLYGSLDGLSATGNQLWDQDSPGIKGVAEDIDLFGKSLAAGDFDNDGADDLAIGIPGEDVLEVADAGAVQVIYGSTLIFADGFESSNTSAWSNAVP
jgi:hypothetical protein